MRVSGTTRALVGGLRAEWREIGGLGRTAIFGLGAAVVLTVVMGFAMTTIFERSVFPGVPRRWPLRYARL